MSVAVLIYILYFCGRPHLPYHTMSCIKTIMLLAWAACGHNAVVLRQKSFFTFFSSKSLFLACTACESVPPPSKIYSKNDQISRLQQRGGGTSISGDW